MNTHTPEPWELRHERHLGKTEHVVKIGTACVYFNRGIGQAEGTAVANARLIAAAPELLAALELMVQHHSNEWLDQSQPIYKTLRKARAAIAKAKGQA